MFRMKSIAAAFAAVAVSVGTLAAPAAWAEPAKSLDELLEQTKNIRQIEESQNAEREAKFKAEHDKQSAMMAEAQAELAKQKKRGVDLAAAFDANEKKIGELQAQLEARSGNLGELFGVVKQVSNDFSGGVRNSMISVQFPDREDFITNLANTKELPSMATLERFWFELLRETAESGKVVAFKSRIVTPGGQPADATVVRVGPFNAMSDGKFLQYLPTEKQFAVMARQPEKFQSQALALQRAKSGYVKSTIDPTRGVMLTIYSLRPNVIERIEKGEAVGYVIITVGVIGGFLAIFQFIYLIDVRRKVKKQLADINRPSLDNPLGRVLATFKGGDANKIEENAEVIELRISEAVLKEVPNLERFQAFLRLAVAAGPLLGLIGTVVGMIITFQSITESGSSDPKLMAAGISQAMIATVLGLGIAIPLLFANAWLTSMSKAIMQILDEQSTGLLAGKIEQESARRA